MVSKEHKFILNPLQTTIYILIRHNSTQLATSEPLDESKFEVDEAKQRDNVNVDAGDNDAPSNVIQIKNDNNELTDIQTLFKYLNEIQIAANKNTNSFIDVRKMLKYIIDRLSKLDYDSLAFMAKIVLILETENENIKKGEKPLKIHPKINENRIEISKIKDISTHIKDLETQLDALSNDIKNFNNKNKADQDNTKQTEEQTRSEINGEYLFLVDSNLAKINPDIMNRGSKCQRFYCPTFNHVAEFLRNVNISSHPETIFFHCGTNCLDNRNEDKFQDDFLEIIGKLKETFPGAKIIISSLLPRTEVNMKVFISNSNDFLSGCCAMDPTLIYMNKINIATYAIR